MNSSISSSHQQGIGAHHCVCAPVVTSGWFLFEVSFLLRFEDCALTDWLCALTWTARCPPARPLWGSKLHCARVFDSENTDLVHVKRTAASLKPRTYLRKRNDDCPPQLQQVHRPPIYGSPSNWSSPFSPLAPRHQASADVLVVPPSWCLDLRVLQWRAWSSPNRRHHLHSGPRSWISLYTPPVTRLASCETTSNNLARLNIVQKKPPSKTHWTLANWSTDGLRQVPTSKSTICSNSRPKTTQHTPLGPRVVRKGSATENIHSPNLSSSPQTPLVLYNASDRCSNCQTYRFPQSFQGSMG